MPIRKQDYPPDWKEISLQVREEAQQRCEWCGALNGKVIRRVKQPFWNPDFPEVDHVLMPEIQETTGEWVDTATMSWARLKFHGLTKVILTVAHLDRDSTNNDRSNLAALCQRCHLRHDLYQHLANRKYGRHHTKDHQKKLEL